MDPDVASLIRDLIDQVDAARTDAGAWARLGLACEANGFGRVASARALETKGMILWQSGRPAQARSVLEAALARDPRNASARVWIGLLLVEQQQPHAALPYFEAALRTNPMLADALVGIGMAPLQLGARDEAAVSLGRAEQIDPANARLATALRLLRANGSAR